jgi:hypothetical protein
MDGVPVKRWRVGLILGSLSGLESVAPRPEGFGGRKYDQPVFGGASALIDLSRVSGR